MVFRLSENAFSTQKIEFFTHALKQNSPPGSYYHLPDPSTLTNLVPTPAEMGEETMWIFRSWSGSPPPGLILDESSLEFLAFLKSKNFDIVHCFGEFHPQFALTYTLFNPYHMHALPL